MNYACRKCQMSCGYQVAKILPYNPPIITHEISNFILYDMCMRDDYHAHISHLSGIMKRHFFPSVQTLIGSLAAIYMLVFPAYCVAIAVTHFYQNIQSCQYHIT